MFRVKSSLPSIFTAHRQPALLAFLGSTFLSGAALVIAVDVAPAFAKETRPNIPQAEMPAFCSGEAAAKFSLSPRDISTLPVERLGSNYRVYGQSPAEGDKSLFFYCEFNTHKEFDRVEMTSDKRVAEPAAQDDVVTVTEMPRFCKGMAAEKFEVKPGRVTTNKALREADGRYRVFGQYITPANDVQVFHCKFSPRGKFLNVKPDNR
jgi:hypothetical protein